MSDPSYTELSQAFDQAAIDYDSLYQKNIIMAWMRAESLALLQTVFPFGSRLLEIGCGTGDEALALGAAGYKIVATDVSAAMIATARAKAEAKAVDNVAWHVVPAGRLALLQTELTDGHEDGGVRFDGAYSSFGALNCEAQLHTVARSLALMLPPGALFVCSVMGRWCAWEIGWGLLHLRPGQAFRRTGSGWIGAGLASPAERLSVPVRYYTPRAFSRSFAPYFELKSVRGLPVVLPPPYLDDLCRRHPAGFNTLARLDRGVRGLFPFRSLGDHFLVVMVRTGVEGGP